MHVLECVCVCFTGIQTLNATVYLKESVEDCGRILFDYSFDIVVVVAGFVLLYKPTCVLS